MVSDKTHITADVPTDLLKEVDARALEIGVSRSFAIRRGLRLFLSTIRQDLTETVTDSRESVDKESQTGEASHAA